MAAEAKLEGAHVLNVAEQETPTMRERTEIIANYMGVDLRWEEVAMLPQELEILGAMPCDFVVASSRLRDVLGFREVTSPSERVADLVGWLRASRARGARS